MRQDDSREMPTTMPYCGASRCQPIGVPGEYSLICDTGTLIFTSPVKAALGTLEWIDRHGQHETLAIEPQDYRYAMVSPDGARVAVERTTGDNRDIWILDLKRLTQTGEAAVRSHHRGEGA